MKYIVKNSDLGSAEQKPYVIRFYHPLKPIITALPEYDPMACEDILITNWQRDNLMTVGRTFWIVTYYPLSVIRFILDNIDGLTHYAFCTHDRDYSSDGVIKKAHTHLLLYFSERVSGSFIASWFHTTEIKIVSRSDVSSEWNYLIHDSEACRRQRKHIYDKSERFSDDENYWLSRCTCQSDNEYYVDMYKDFAFKKMSGVDFVRKYGYESIRSARNLKELLNYFCDNLHDDNYWKNRQRVEAILERPDFDLVAFREFFSQGSFEGGKK